MGAPVSEVRTEILRDARNPQLLVHVLAADGFGGIGETWWGTFQPSARPGAPVEPIASLIDTVLAPMCVGHDSEDIELLWRRLVKATAQYGPEGIVSSAISGIDIALWDLVARRRGVPVHSLLGPVVHDAVPAYASLTWLGDVDRVCEDATRAIAHGFRAVKLHEANVALVLEARRRLGPEVALMLDASARFDEPGAVNAAAELAEAQLTWLEEPLYPQTDHAALARVRSGSSIPIAAGENEFSLAGFARLIDSGAVDVVQPEIAKFGGLTPARDIADVAQRAGLALCPHNYSLGPSFRANVHWAVTSTATRWLEVPWLPDGQSFPSGMTPPTLVDGCVTVPSGSGL